MGTCKNCGDTGLTVPIDSIALLTLLKIQKDDVYADCDYCAINPNFELYDEYINNLIDKHKFKENI